MAQKIISKKANVVMRRARLEAGSSIYHAGMLRYGAASCAFSRFLGQEQRCLFGSQQVRLVSHSSTKKPALGRELLVSVLESANKRDAKIYLNKYAQSSKRERPPLGPGLHLPGTIRDRPLFIQGPRKDVDRPPRRSSPVSIVKISLPQTVDDATMKGVAKTLSQLRTLGLVSVIVVDCGPESNPSRSHEQACRLLYFLHEFDNISAVVLENVMAKQESDMPGLVFPSTGRGIYVSETDSLFQTLKEDKIPIITEYSATLSSGWKAEKIPAEGIVVGLVRFFSGMQSSSPQDEEAEWEDGGTRPLAAVETVVVLDPAGGIPVASNISVPHRFVNLEAEYEPIVENLSRELADLQRKSENQPEKATRTILDQAKAVTATHLRNLEMVRDALSLLPSAASALITTPSVAANTARASDKASLNVSSSARIRNLVHMPVGTRPTQNPLIHNLLTGKPVYSSSLPLEKVSRRDSLGRQSAKTEIATLVKRGMPVTIFPSPDLGPWHPPKPGEPRLRLTDTCLDLARLIYLIEDSFNRKLDVRDYLNRIHDNLAGVIIAGNYEGGAILTWERPFALSEEEAYRNGRLVPYLDKFAVLKSRQGSGGVADIVFNAMVQDCFPAGVCWRSRRNNPVNKWYFERSVGGTVKLQDTQWTMFWTTAGLEVEDQALKDYESVCREIQPSWADKKHIAD